MMKKIRFGIVGTNFISDWVLTGAMMDERFEPVAIYSRRQETADAFAAKHGIPYTFTSLEDMVSSDLLDAVYIASPNFKHAEQSILCMNHGKHVLCEKPLASNAKEVRWMLDAARKNKVTLMEAMKSTLTPNFKAIQCHLADLGVIRRYFSAYCQYSSRYDKYKLGEIANAFKPEMSNGGMMDIGIYTLYPMIVLFGKPLKVQASGLLLSTGVDGQGAVNFEYEGMNATILYSKIANSSLPTEIQGEEGTLVVDRINCISQVSRIAHKMMGPGGKMERCMEDVSLPTDKDEYYYEIAEFINLIESGRCESEVNSWANSLATIEVIDEIRRQLGVHYPADL